MPAYVIAQMTVHDIDMYYDYASKVFATITPFGGKLVAANDAEIREGALPYVRTIVGEFPDTEAARSWYDSDAYQAIIGLRQNSTDGALFFVEGLSMPPRKKQGE
ncbi:MAG: DUF1330 domain-containing protein [Dehalococcoidia bacterium]